MFLAQYYRPSPDTAHKTGGLSLACWHGLEFTEKAFAEVFRETDTFFE